MDFVYSNEEMKAILQKEEELSGNAYEKAKEDMRSKIERELRRVLGIMKRAHTSHHPAKIERFNVPFYVGDFNHIGLSEFEQALRDVQVEICSVDLFLAVLINNGRDRTMQIEFVKDITDGE